MLMHEIWSVGERPFPTLSIPEVSAQVLSIELHATPDAAKLTRHAYHIPGSQLARHAFSYIVVISCACCYKWTIGMSSLYSCLCPT